MKNVIAIAVFLLIFGPAYGREKHSVRKLGALKAAVTASQKASETGDSDTEGQDMDDTDTETDDQTTGNNKDTDTDDTDTDDQDTTDMNKNDDTDDKDGTTTTVKSAIRSALKVLALNRSEKPFASEAASLNVSVTAPQTVAQLLEPANSGHTAVASAAILQAAGGSSAAVASGALIVSDNATIAVSGSSSGGKLSVTVVPEPTSCLLLAIGTLPWLWIRRRLGQ